jgi:23S rRNA pseudouridine2605 synthase
MQERLQKIIARAGIASRRKAEELIEQGEVTVNGKITTELGSKADSSRDHIKVRGKLLSARSGELIYLVLNKPRDCVSTTSDPEGRRTVLDLVGRFRSKVYPVGRLDYHSEGLLLLTNDGDFANHILSAKSAIPKTYHVKVNGRPRPADFAKFRNGIRLDGRLTEPATIRLLKPGENPWYEITLTEGRQNQIRRMFKSLGFLVEKLKRARIGPLALGSLGLGTFRELTPEELKRLSKARAVAPDGDANSAAAAGKPRTGENQRAAAKNRRSVGSHRGAYKRNVDERGAEKRGPIERSVDKRGPDKRSPDKRYGEKRGPVGRGGDTQRGAYRRNADERGVEKRGPRERSVDKRSPDKRDPDKRYGEKRGPGGRGGDTQRGAAPKRGAKTTRGPRSQGFKHQRGDKKKRPVRSAKKLIGSR